MGMVILRLFLVIISSLSGYIIGRELWNYENSAWTGLLAGFLFAIFIVSFELNVEKTPVKTVLGGVIGIIVGLVIANLLSLSLFLLNLQENSAVNLSVCLLINAILGYLGIMIGLKKGGELALPAEGFYVEGSEGPLKEGELERAADWARQILAAP